MTILQRLVKLLEAAGVTGRWLAVDGLSLLGQPVEEAYEVLTFGSEDPITIGVTDEGNGLKRIHQTAEWAHESRVFKADEEAFRPLLREFKASMRRHNQRRE